MSTPPSLFDSYRLGDITLSNRIVMAPLTRNRASAGLVPSPLAVEYYGQRASAGLIVTEATQISDTAQGYQDTPGIFTDAQVEGWKKVTDTVHAKGGHIFVQMWHVGRVSHRSLQPGGAAPLAPSAVRANTKTYVNNGFAEVDEPRALTLDEIKGVVEDFGKAAANAIRAGFDGVEIHGANGYLIDQFLRDGANKRTDEYGGSIENRTRFLKEVLESVTGAIGAKRTGIRLSPVTPANDLSDSDPQPLFNHAMDVVESFHPVYVHMIEGATQGPRDIVPDFDFEALRNRYSGTWMVNNGYDKAMAEKAVATGKADLVAFGRGFVSSPDAVERLRRGAAFNEIDRATLYGGGAKGYIDYPTLEAVGA
ncbi:NADH:flavin oxidoreductase/NADH oxidase [Ancylobacter novellus DSM 506]|uniref:NADH:flavin oxidoreductase/NADH oxidase n=1 Tax=Ancylobacter novellus (strain ATCC 8093 / DSM 506 / JCM 20403 / CCM 1077 / IAM 12100 / NBRC 12443 / NCIMB 10456) TaxID=639283 RepID=D7A2A3_ANCN5|nr:alkene reductase [Ancylobacter novellus]ADH89566.1 NADH:flavin oxidoreductase/NADH oxidase [Ancylobacter novellus DSM 506]